MAEFTPINLAYSLVEPSNSVDGRTPVIFLHGLTASKDYWNDIPEIVANKTGSKVYVVDARNHGDSEWSEIFSFDINAKDLLHFMDNHNIKKATLVGHSMGGITAIKVALKHPDRINCLVVEDISPRKAPAEAVQVVKIYVNLAILAIQQVPPDVSEEEAGKLIKEFVFKNLPPEIQVMASKSSRENIPIRLNRGPDGRYSYKANMAALLKFLSDPESLKNENSGVYKGPAFFIYGKESPFLVSKDETFIKELFPAVELIGIENATHTVHTDCPTEFTDNLLKCLLKQ